MFSIPIDGFIDIVSELSTGFEGLDRSLFRVSIRVHGKCEVTDHCYNVEKALMIDSN